MCTREVTLESQQPESSSRTRIPYVRYNLSLIEAAENVEILMNDENMHCLLCCWDGMNEGNIMKPADDKIFLYCLCQDDNTQSESVSKLTAFKVEQTHFRTSCLDFKSDERHVN